MLFLFAAVAAGDSTPGCSQSSWSWGTFLLPYGSVWTGTVGCSGTPVATCGFTGDYSLKWGDRLTSVSIACPVFPAGTFSMSLSALGMQVATASGPASTCQQLEFETLGVSARIDCKPGFLVFLVPALLLLLVLLCCYCGCCCCCRRAKAGAGAQAAAPATSYIVLQPAEAAQQGYTPPQAPLLQSQFLAPPPPPPPFRQQQLQQQLLPTFFPPPPRLEQMFPPPAYPSTAVQ